MKNYQTIKRQAEDDDPVAQYELALMYPERNKIEHDFELNLG